MPGKGWTKERDETAVAMRKSGLGGSEIAQLLGVSRNAVIGRLYRLKIDGLLTGSFPKERKPRAAPKPKPRPNTVREPQKLSDALAPTKWEEPIVNLFAPVPAGHNVTFADLAAHHCRYVIGDANGLETRYCGQPRKLLSAYCAGCHAITHVKPKIQAQAVAA